MTWGEEREADRLLPRLVRLAQEATIDPLSSSERDGLARLELEIANLRLLGRARSNGLSWLIVMDLAVSIAAIVLVTTYRHSVPGFAVGNGTAGNDAYVRHPVPDDARIQFADGAEAVLESGARTRVAEVYPSGARIVLEDGKAHFCITPIHSAKWLVEAGPYSLQVAGTVFDVAWTESEASLDLWLHTGSITIFGPLFPKGLAVRPGQRLIARAEKVLLMDGRPFEDMSAMPSSTKE
jgi:ferric-dicitrate binding protein FerR (iron transport regulator)